AFRACGSLQMESLGWVPPLGRNGTQLTHAAVGNIAICLRKEQKVLPASVVREMVEEKLLALEQEEGRPLRRREREGIKDEVLLSMLPRAFARATHCFAYISPKESLLAVDAATPRVAEELISLLRVSLGSMAVVPVAVKEAPSAVMTRWLDGKSLPRDFEIEDECELRDPEVEGGVVRCKRQDLLSGEIRTHLRAGKQVVKLAVNWDRRLSCVFGEDLAVKRLRFSDVVQEQSGDAKTDDEVACFDNDFALMTMELSRFIPRLMEVCGGEDEGAYVSTV
ncbi:MAG: recombination-associated protein RdgC, partial [Gammaproteobacteria bacterium]|nr:recombination-associated protein RdgC [Gammaproteobacteria bacterium]